MSAPIHSGDFRLHTAHNPSMETARMQQAVPVYTGQAAGLVGSCNVQYPGRPVHGVERGHSFGSRQSGDAAAVPILQVHNPQVWGGVMLHAPQQQPPAVVPSARVPSDPYAPGRASQQYRMQQHPAQPHQVHAPQHHQVHPFHYQHQQPQQHPHTFPYHPPNYAQQQHSQPMHVNTHCAVSQPAHNFVRAQRRTSASSDVSSLSDDVDTRLRFNAAAAEGGQHLAVPGNDAKLAEGIPPTWVVEIPSAGTTDFQVEDEDLLSMGSLALSSSPPKRDHSEQVAAPSVLPTAAADMSPYLSHNATIPRRHQPPLVRSASSSNVARSRSNPPGHGRAAFAATSRARGKDQTHYEGHKQMTNFSYHGVTHRMRASSASPAARHERTSTFHSQQGFGEIAGLALDLNRRTGGDLRHEPAAVTRDVSVFNTSHHSAARTFDSNGKRVNSGGGGASSRSPGTTATTATTAGSGSLSSSVRDATPLKQTLGSARMAGTATNQSLRSSPSSSRRRDKNGRKGAGLHRAAGCFT